MCFIWKHDKILNVCKCFLRIIPTNFFSQEDNISCSSL